MFYSKDIFNKYGLYMRGKGACVFLLVCILTLGAYFFVFGFSNDPFTRYGQYAAMICLGLTLIDAYFRE